MPRTRDAASNALYVISGEDSKAFSGKLWTANRYVASVGATSTTDVTITQTATNVAYAKISISSSQISVVSIYEGTTVSNAGTAITSYNRNRSVAGSASSTVHHTPTVSAAGTEILPSFLLSGSTTGPIAVVGSWLLKADTKYLIRLTNNGASAAAVGIFIEWYES